MEMRHMIKKIAWDAFKNTGDINTFLEYKEIENAVELGVLFVCFKIRFIDI